MLQFGGAKPCHVSPTCLANFISEYNNEQDKEVAITYKVPVATLRIPNLFRIVLCPP